MAPQEQSIFLSRDDDTSFPSSVLLHVFGNPASDFTKNMGILHQRKHEEAGYEADVPLTHHYALIHPGALWSFPNNLTEEELRKAPKYNLASAIKKITELNISIAIVHVHTTHCNYKVLFELLDIPIIGSGGEASANVADKATSRALMMQAGVKVPHGAIIENETFQCKDFSPERFLEQHGLAFPLVVKPTRMEASVGVIKVNTSAEMVDALRNAFNYGETAIIDEFIVGREVRAGVLCRNGNVLEKLSLIEYNIDHNEIRGMDKKVEKDGKTLVNLPNSFSYIQEEDDPVLHAAMHETACKAHRALGCRDFSFIDCRVTESGEVFVLEINVFAAFNPGSIMSKLTTAAGISHREFWGSMVNKALSRLAEAQRRKGA